MKTEAVSNVRGRLLIVAVAALFTVTGPAAAAPLNLPVNPLFVSTSVQPNVMLLLDNSGSMHNIIWDSGFDPTVTYPNYSTNTCGGSNNVRCWYESQGNVNLRLYRNYQTDCSNQSSAFCNNLPGLAATGQGIGPERGSCPTTAEYRAGRLNGTGPERCLVLPDPQGGGLTRYSGNYLNYLYHTKVADNGTADLTATIPNQARIQAARQVAAQIVTDNPDVRFGTSSFQTNNNGGKIDSVCGADQATVLAQINALTASTNTPLAETYYEITRYFRGLTRYSGSGSGNYISPIQYRCQKNFVVAVTDGFPTFDGTFPVDDPDDVANTASALPNWDGLAPATTADQYPNFPQHSDGYSGLDAQPEGAALYLDDLAKFGFDLDAIKSGNDLSGGSFQDPAFAKQNIGTYAVGFAVNNQMLQDAADYGGGLYRTASNASELTAALQAALTDIAARGASFSSASLNSTSLNAGTRLFQAGFNSANWTGTLTAIPISTAATGSCAPQAGLPCAPAWEASSVLNAATPDSRTIMTLNRATRTGIPFRWASLPVAQQDLLHRNPNVLPSLAADARGEARLNYLRGDRSQEGTGNLRPRGSRLGDIVDSDPAFVGAPNAALPFAGYSSFRSSNSGRTPMVYVGANDGMLHGFRVSDGTELLAYVPGMMYGTDANPKLARLTALPYTHIWGVDGSPAVADVQIGPSQTWATYLVGTMRYGAQGLFALDVTDPANFSEANAASVVKWEFTDADDPDLGYTFSQPSIVKLKNGKWAAIVGNGYNNREADGSVSSDGAAALFVIFLDGPGSDGIWNLGTDYLKFKVGPAMSGTEIDNGLATPSPVDLDGDSLVDYIYAGDLRGDVWQFNVNSIDPSLWSVGYSGNPLFTAISSTGLRQPITAPMEVGFNLLTTDPDDLVVFFGTGRYLAAGDNTQIGQDNQSFYGIFANPIASPSPLSETSTSPYPIRSSLLQQTIVQEGGPVNGQRFRITSRNALNLATHKGWYIDLVSPAAGTNQGERQISRPILRDGRIVFTTIVPSDDACNPDGTGWLMEIDARTGAGPAKPALDINNDLVVDATDVIQTTIDGQAVQLPTSGLFSDGGMLSTPAVLAISPGQEAKYSVRSDGTTAVFGEAASGRTGRVTWREIAP